MGVSFEDNLKKLENAAALLKNGELSLEDALKAYEDGIEAYNCCNDVLNDARQRIEVLRRDD